MYSHGSEKYPCSTLLMSSATRHWASVEAELRRHAPSEGPGYSGEQIEISVIVEGDSDSFAACKFGRSPIGVPTSTGTTWVCPPGVPADEIRITAPELTSVHLYMPLELIHTVAAHDFRGRGRATIRYASIHEDAMVGVLCRAIVEEMACETSAGRLLVDSASNTLAAWLVKKYSEDQDSNLHATTGKLDKIRLKRVVDFIDQNLEEEITLASLASIACLSEFHFSRMFAAATGLSPARFVSRRRLENARKLVTEGKMSLSEIALKSRFSSQASFTRAFRRSVGAAPGEYRRQVGRLSLASSSERFIP
jgi:AraC family transcriptional regulator